MPIRSRGEGAPSGRPTRLGTVPAGSNASEGGRAVTEQHGAAGVAEDREAVADSDRLLAGLVLTLIVFVQAAWFAGLVYLGARFLL